MERHLVPTHLQLQHFRGGVDYLPHQTWSDPKSALLLLHLLERLLPFYQGHPIHHHLSRQPFLSPPSQLLSAETILKTPHSPMPLQKPTALHPHHVFHPPLAVQNLHHLHRLNKSPTKPLKKSQTKIMGPKEEPLQLHAHSHRMWSCHVLMDQTLPSGTKCSQTSSGSWEPSNWKNWWSWRRGKKER